MLLGFGTNAAERRSTGKYFILGRYLGVVLLGMVIATLGLVFVGYMTNLILLFGVLTIVFGGLIAIRLFTKYRNVQKNAKLVQCTTKKSCSSCSNMQNESGLLSCNSCTSSKTTDSSTGLVQCSHECKNLPKSLHGTNLTKRYTFLLGLFRGATPCLKIIIIAPLLIVVDLSLAFLMVLVFAAASTIYTVIGFVSASILTNFRKYENYIQATGACVLICIGVYTIFKYLLTQPCLLGV